MNKLPWFASLIVIFTPLIVSVFPYVTTPPRTDFGQRPELSEIAAVREGQVPPMVPGVVLVGLRSEVTVNQHSLSMQTNNNQLNGLFTKLGVQSVEPVFRDTKILATSTLRGGGLDLSHIYRLSLPSEANILHVLEELNSNPAVAYAEP